MNANKFIFATFDTVAPSPAPAFFLAAPAYSVSENGTNVLVAGQGAIYRSTNGGSTWSTSVTGAGIGEDFINSLAIDPLATSNVYAGDFHIDSGTGSSFLIVKSIDGGDTWTELSRNPSLTLLRAKPLSTCQRCP